jgi:opacity protein-like surface antigen
MTDHTTVRIRPPAPLIALAVLLGTAAPLAAQGFGVGARLAWVNRDVTVEADSVRFVGGQLRLDGGRVAIEVAVDRRSETFEALGEKIVETPIQASLLLRLTSGRLSPYLLGGPGWYRRRVERIDGPDDLTVSTTEFGWHAGIGLEIRVGRHAGIHGDYRYTFLDFNDDDDEEIGGGVIGRLLPGHKGSMWTLGATVYF